jgi:hypothetical protein
LVARFLIVVLLLSSAVSLSARGRAHGYQAGGGTHRLQAKVPGKKQKEKPRKPAPPPQPPAPHS